MLLSLLIWFDYSAYIGSHFQWWQKFGLTEESSLRLIETSTDALASDELLCHWLRMERLADRLYWHSLQGDMLQIMPDIEQGMEKCLDQMNAHGVPRMLPMFCLDSSRANIMLQTHS